ncbi:MAG: hypothetical protein BJ554DRAFT_3550, partial [Olpidium bornovanus]
MTFPSLAPHLPSPPPSVPTATRLARFFAESIPNLSSRAGVWARIRRATVASIQKVRMQGRSIRPRNLKRIVRCRRRLLTPATRDVLMREKNIPRRRPGVAKTLLRVRRRDEEHIGNTRRRGRNGGARANYFLKPRRKPPAPSSARCPAARRSLRTRAPPPPSAGRTSAETPHASRPDVPLPVSSVRAEEIADTSLSARAAAACHSSARRRCSNYSQANSSVLPVPPPRRSGRRLPAASPPAGARRLAGGRARSSAEDSGGYRFRRVVVSKPVVPLARALRVSLFGRERRRRPERVAKRAPAAAAAADALKRGARG